MTRIPSLVVHLSGNNLSSQSTVKLDEWVRNALIVKETAAPVTEPISSVDNCDETKEPQDEMQSEQAVVSAKSTPYLSLPNQQDMHGQVALQNSLQQKDIKMLRQQNIRLQAQITSFENELSSAALRTVELEQTIARHDFDKQQLNKLLQDSRERLLRVNEDQSRLLSGWAIERTELAAQTTSIVRERDADIRNLRAEVESLKDMLRRAEVSYCSLVTQS